MANQVGALETDLSGCPWDVHHRRATLGVCPNQPENPTA